MCERVCPEGERDNCVNMPIYEIYEIRSWGGWEARRGVSVLPAEVAAAHHPPPHPTGACAGTAQRDRATAAAAAAATNGPATAPPETP